MFMDENTQIFISESNELLDDMEKALLELERSPNDADLINRVFRAAHTIKGSAGLFGFDNIIEFTHVVENLLDDVRNCLVPVTDDLISLFMRVKDHVVSMIKSLADGSVVDAKQEQILLEKMRVYKAGEHVNAADVSQEDPIINDACGSEEQVESEFWHISIRLGPDTFQMGFSPKVMFDQLRALGDIESVNFVTDLIPPLDSYAADNCYLGWELTMSSEADKNSIAQVFAFFDDAQISILPPRSRISDYQKMLEQLPENDEVLGKLLVDIGALTESELQQALNYQKNNGGLSGEILIEQGAVQPEVVNSAVIKQQAIRNKKQQELSFVRVASEKLDKLVTLVGELVISGAKVSQIAADRSDMELAKSMESMTLALEDMRETALGLRMVPVANTFNRFHRVIRDTAKELNKKIRLEVFGGETELDKTVIEKIGDPLVHLIRNSMDHGIETPDVRKNNGKPEEGVISLKAYHETGTIVIEVSDDGAGLNPEKLLEIAIQRGVVNASQSLTVDEIYNLIFEPGFSTAGSVSNISGRGVGMDVVRRNIESLRGSVVVQSVLGKGVTMIIRLPLTLAIIDGFHVRVSDESFIIPLDMMEECVTLTESQRHKANVQNYINLRDEVLPLIQLDDYLGISAKNKSTTRMNVVVVLFAGKKLGLLVDELYGEAQAVIKPLGRVFQGVRGFAGFTILGSGQLALIMDIPDLVKSAIEREEMENNIQDRINTGDTDNSISLH